MSDPAATPEPEACTVMFADVAGSSRLYELVGDRAALERVHTCLAKAAEAVREHGGEVLKTIGDEILCVFPDAASALLAAGSMQVAVRALPPVQGVAAALRIGLHTGPVLRTVADAHGDTVNVAARIVALAGSGQILLGDAAWKALPTYARVAIRPLGETTLRGLHVDMRLHEALWHQEGETTVLAESPGAQVARALPTAELQIGERRWRLERGIVTIGRDAANEVVLATTRASRNHARLEARDGRFVLRDCSTNGTFVEADGGEVVRVRRSEHPLEGSGRLYFGDDPGTAGAESLRFSIG